MMREVSETEFHKFIMSYPVPLERDVVTFCDPPVAQHNDFSLGDWPHSVVAQRCFNGKFYLREETESPAPSTETTAETNPSSWAEVTVKFNGVELKPTFAIDYKEP